MGLYNEVGYRDNVSQFIHSSANWIAEPAFVDMGNGIGAYEFTNNESLMVTHHINHDIKPNGNTYFHVHFAPTVAMTVGQTLTWQVAYETIIGHHQGGLVNNALTTINIVYTADGTEQAGEHLIVETGTPITTPEPDTIILSKITYLTGTYTGSCYGFMLDAHYEVDRNATPSKDPDFYV